MKVEPYIDPAGIARERERAAYRVVLLHGGDRLCLGFVPKREGLSCLEFVPAFAMALKPDTSPETARCWGNSCWRTWKGWKRFTAIPMSPSPAPRRLFGFKPPEGKAV